ncbi:uncharacterized serine-rich protein C215.13 [Melanotaenia boesemani]|uniref:uncharacterized serine-rich protein C215.13 n=1 Tax=Melanotaenia boesemani TaxID=1250792 RepID=UPI001C04588F|nr:uncharacterized serine-rich protein C215.13 [Melanotaenia boesemani]
MAPSTFTKDAGILHLLLLGLLLPSVSGQDSSTTSGNTIVSTTQATVSSTSENTIQPSSSNITVATTNTATSQQTAMTTNNSATTTSQSTMSNTSTYGVTSGASTSSSTYSLTTTSEGMVSSSTLSPTPTTSRDSASSSTHSLTTTSESTASKSTLSYTVTSGGSASNSTHGNTNVTTGNTTSNATSMNTIYCPSFNCSYSECYSTYITQNLTKCSDGDYCQLLKSTAMWYIASCSSPCAESCVNTSQTNCSVNCCNSTGCLNNTFASMMTTTTAPGTTTTGATQPNPTTTTANNSKKCQMGTCTGENCYTSFKTLQICSSSQPHCQLKKETINSVLTWTAGCTNNCTGQTACKASTQPPCYQECCNATVTSCLMLNGTVNVPSFATRGPQLHTEVIVSLLCLLAITLLL